MEYQGSFDECLWELGQKKDAGMSGFTWPDVAEILNQKYNLTYDESVYRKRYRKLKKTAEVPDDLYFDHDSTYNRTLAANAKELEKQRVLLRERQSLARKAIKQEAFADDFWKELSEKIIKLPAVNVRENQFKIGNREMIAMLSDIHYGLAFTSPYGDYNPKVAEYRVMSYANELCKIAR